MSVNFILDAIKAIHNGNISDNEIEIMYDFIIKLDNESLIRYFKANSIVSYKNDLELCVEMITSLIKVYELTENYEKCGKLLTKKQEAESIIKSKCKKNV